MQPRYTNLSSIEPHPDYPLKMYYADEVDARITEDNATQLRLCEEAQIAAGTIAQQGQRIRDLEKALREAIEWNWLDEEHPPDLEIRREVTRVLGLDDSVLMESVTT